MRSELISEFSNRIQFFSLPQNFAKDSPLRPSNTLGIGMGTLCYFIGLYFGILKSHAKFSLPQNFESELLRRPFNTLGVGMGALWYAIGIHFGILKSHSKFFAPAKF